MNAISRRALAAVCACALLLGGCERAERGASDGASVALPEPEAQPANQILGEQNLNERREVTLHCPTGGSLELTTVSRSISSGPGEALIRSAVEALLALTPSIGVPTLGQASLLGVELSGETVTLRLSLDAAANRSGQDYLLLCASIANTLLEMEGVEAVNILTGERSASLCGLPLGAFSAQTSSVAASYAQIQAESERFPSDGISSIRRTALLYFPDRGGRYLLPEAREIVFASDDYAGALLAALQEGPQLREGCFSAAPASLELSAAAPELSITAEGERALELHLTSTLTNYLALSGVEPWQFYGALTLSLTSFMPELDAVRISIDGAYVTSCALPDGQRQFADGLMRRSDFSSLIGGGAQLCYVREDGSLAMVERALSREAATSPLCLLEAMLVSPSEDLQSVFPLGVSAEDFLGIAIEGRVATVNLSGNFYALCQSLDAGEERALIYGVVNTLSQLEDVGAVAFLIEGEQVESLAQNIYLRTALLPDPGLLATPSPEPEPSPEA